MDSTPPGSQLGEACESETIVSDYLRQRNEEYSRMMKDRCDQERAEATPRVILIDITYTYEVPKERLVELVGREPQDHGPTGPTDDRWWMEAMDAAEEWYAKHHAGLLPATNPTVEARAPEPSAEERAGWAT